MADENKVVEAQWDGSAWKLPAGLDHGDLISGMALHLRRQSDQPSGDARSEAADMIGRMNPAAPAYTPWRHGGWYVNNVRYPSGACGCVSRNYPDKKWRITCDARRAELHGAGDFTFGSRDEAAAAEMALAVGEWCKVAMDALANQRSKGEAPIASITQRPVPTPVPEPADAPLGVKDLTRLREALERDGSLDRRAAAAVIDLAERCRRAAERVVDSASSEGCTDDLAVVSSDAVHALHKIVYPGLPSPFEGQTLIDADADEADVGPTPAMRA